jgi:hypothetical protein
MNPNTISLFISYTMNYSYSKIVGFNSSEKKEENRSRKIFKLLLGRFEFEIQK